jgi:hypothetical protein
VRSKLVALLSEHVQSGRDVALVYEEVEIGEGPPRWIGIKRFGEDGTFERDYRNTLGLKAVEENKQAGGQKKPTFNRVAVNGAEAARDVLGTDRNLGVQERG